MPSISTWMSSSRSSRLDDHVDYQGLAAARRHGSPAQLASISASAPPGRHPMQQTARRHTCMRPVTWIPTVTGRKRTGSHGPLFRSQIWVMVLVGAAPIPQLSCAGPRAGWPAARRMAVGHRPRVAGSTARHHAAGVAGRPRAQVRRMGRTCPPHNEHELAPDLVRRIRNSSRPATPRGMTGRVVSDSVGFRNLLACWVAFQVGAAPVFSGGTPPHHRAGGEDAGEQHGHPQRGDATSVVVLVIAVPPTRWWCRERRSQDPANREDTGKAQSFFRRARYRL
jgi:hypothetical protein